VSTVTIQPSAASLFSTVKHKTRDNYTKYFSQKNKESGDYVTPGTYRKIGDTTISVAAPNLEAACLYAVQNNAIYNDV